MTRTCGVCGETCGDGPDPCLGQLPYVISACCGHGVTPPYLWTDRYTYYHGEAVAMMRWFGGNPPDLDYKPGWYAPLTAEQRHTASVR